MTAAMSGAAGPQRRPGTGSAHPVAGPAGAVGAAGAAGAAGTVDVVDEVLRLLRGLPERPARLRVRAADLVVDLDWRTPPVPAAGPATTDGAAGARPADGPAPATAASTAAAAAPEPAVEVHYVCAPSVGTFYLAPGPEAAPFVEVDAVVDSGQQVGIVEAMKLMLPVEADRAGRVVEVLVDNGQPVEFGQRLMAMTPVVAP